MKRKLFCGLALAVFSLLLAIPAYAYTGTADGGNGGLGNGMGNGTHDSRLHVQSTDGSARTNQMPHHRVSVYGTDTGTQFLNVNPNVPGLSARNPVLRPQSNANGGYRALATNDSNDMNWSWLGLLGLLGLFGIRSRNPQRD
ncbi:WGxxGxxG family protein [Cohnella sp. GCM10027633]|uniref:WGxxGxxG family protein n=1 Tax=unclassified Cohnella TaxID=2636738 RepID=UPI0036387751